jgi:hypothetical protein
VVVDSPLLVSVETVAGIVVDALIMVMGDHNRDYDGGRGGSREVQQGGGGRSGGDSVVHRGRSPQRVVVPIKLVVERVMPINLDHKLGVVVPIKLVVERVMPINLDHKLGVVVPIKLVVERVMPINLDHKLGVVVPIKLDVPTELEAPVEVIVPINLEDRATKK